MGYVLKARVKFSKTGKLKYIGHLDMMRYFQKAISRAKLPVAYSQGFNPHQIMTFSNPLGIGMTSVAEYMDIELEEVIPSAEAIERLNEVMVEDIKVLSFKYLPDGTKNAMASTAAARYKVKLKESLAEYKDTDFQTAIANFLSQNSCFITRQTKKSTTETDILPLIYEFTYDTTNKCFIIKCCADSTNNLKPEIIMEQLFRHMNIDIILDRVNLAIERLELYNSDGISLDDVGKEI